MICRPPGQSGFGGTFDQPINLTARTLGARSAGAVVTSLTTHMPPAEDSWYPQLEARRFASPEAYLPR